MIGRRLRIGLVGAGNIAQIAQLPVLAADPTVTIAGVVTLTEQSAAANMRRWPVESAYATLEEMIAKAALDAVFVLTPRRLHTDAVEAALSAGLDVFCEKPLADTSEQAERLAERATAAGRMLMVDMNRRFAPVYQAAYEAFSGADVQFCVAQKNRAGSEYRATLENAIHMVDLLRWFCGEPIEVAAHAIAPDPWQEAGVAALIRFEHGAIGSLIAARSAGEWDERLDSYGGLTSAHVLAPDSVRIVRDGEARTVDLRPRSLGWVNATRALGFEGAVHHFLGCVRTRETPLTNGVEAAKTQRLLEAVLQACGLPVEDKPDHEWRSHSQQ